MILRQLNSPWVRGLLVSAALASTACTQGTTQGPAGPVGPAGEQGIQGAPGEAGAKGDAASPVLLMTVVEPSGATCLSGGVKLLTGKDADSDGVLEDEEIETDAIRVICNGVAGPGGETGATGADGAPGPQGPTGANGFTTLAKTTLEPTSSAACPSGGVTLESGVDLDRNGSLEANEIDAAATKVLCNGAQGLPGDKGDTGSTGATGLATIVATAAEAAGTNCATGGVKLEWGVDANGDGTLEASEVNAALTRYTCNGEQGPTGVQGATGSSTAVRTSAEPAGANCATGGVKLEFGADVNANATLEAGEVNAALTRYTCNGAQGPQGVQGIQGPAGATGATGATGGTGSQGPQGPQGTAGALALYGDGSAGAFSVPVGNTLDLTTIAGVNSLAGRSHMQFTNINIAGNLILPSGTVLRATGDVTVTGTITVLTGAEDPGAGQPIPGVALSAPLDYVGGRGLNLLAASELRRPPAAAGGAGSRLPTANPGGAGGGSLVIAARGNISVLVGGNIIANGNNGVQGSSVTGDVGGPGGGAGGVIVLAAKGNLTIGGAVRANGGSGGSAANTNGGTTGAGGGGGGGGGIIQLLSSASPAITGTVQANGGAGGFDLFGAPNSNFAGQGGGACGGNGGNGGGAELFSLPANAAQAGGAGHIIQLVVPSPENLFL